MWDIFLINVCFIYLLIIFFKPKDSFRDMGCFLPYPDPDHNFIWAGYNGYDDVSCLFCDWVDG